MISKFKKNVNIDIYKCKVYDKGSATIEERIERVKEGYNINKIFENVESLGKEILCEAVKIDTEKHEIIFGINLDTMEITVLKDNIVNK